MSKLKISCQEANHVCDKTQYKEVFQVGYGEQVYFSEKCVNRKKTDSF